MSTLNTNFSGFSEFLYQQVGFASTLGQVFLRGQNRDTLGMVSTNYKFSDLLTYLQQKEKKEKKIKYEENKKKEKNLKIQKNITYEVDKKKQTSCHPQFFSIPVHHKLDSEVVDCIQNINTLVSSLVENKETIGVDLNLNLSTEDLWKKVPLMLFSLIALYYLYQGNTKYASAFGAICALLQVTHPILSKYLDRITCISGDFESQGVSESDDTIASTILSILLFLSTGRDTNKPFSAKILNYLNNFGKMKTHIDKSMSVILRCLLSIFEYFKCDYLASIISPNDKDLVKGVREWIAEVVNVMDKAQSGTLPIDRANYNYLHSLVMRGRSFSANVFDREVAAKIRSMVQPYMQGLNKLWMPFEQACFGDNQFKVEPLAILLSGIPGVGKSLATIPLLSELMVEVLPESMLQTFVDKPMDNIYCRKNEHKYWDGYHGQFATVFDDFGQSVDFAQNSESEYMDLIRVINAFPHICHMASIENKGSVEFRSEVVLATTNMTTLQCKSILEPSAVLRRFDVCLWVCPKLEYSDGDPSPLRRKLDKSKLPRGDDGLPVAFCKDVYQFFPYDMARATILGDPYSYDQLVTLLVNAYHDKFSRGDKLNSVIKDIIKDRAERKGVVAQSFFDQDIDDILRGDTVDPVELLARDLSTSEFNTNSIGYDVWRDWLTYIKQVKESFFLKLKDLNLKDIFRVHSAFVNSLDFSKYTRWVFDHLPSPTSLRTHADALFKYLSSFLPDVSYLTLAIGILSLVATTYTVIQGLSSKNTEQFDSGEKASKVSYRAKRRIIYPNQRAEVLPQFGDRATIDMSKNLITSNMFEIVRVSDTRVLGHALFLDRKYIMLPAHYIGVFRRGIKTDLELDPDKRGIELVNEILNESYKISYTELVNSVAMTLTEQDIVFLSYPTRIRRFRNIRNHFVSNVDVPVRHWNQGVLSNLEDNYVCAHSTSYMPETDFHVGRAWGGYDVLRGYSYHIPTRNGDCGSLLFAAGPGKINAKIIGLHVAGNTTSFGFASAICIEDLPPLPTEGAMPQFLEGFIDLGPADPPVHQPCVSSIIKSPLYGVFGTPKQKQALLCKKDGIDPWENATSKYAHNDIVLPDLFFRALYDVFKDICAVGAPNADKYRRVLTFDEAIRGVPDLPFIEAIPRNTSPGYPFSCYAEGKGKTMWLGKGDEYDLLNANCVSLRHKIERDLVRLQTQRGNFLYTDFLKDETRPIDRVLQGKTRMVSGCPMDLSIITRMYYAGFAGWFMSNRVRNGSAVGVNVYSNEWTSIYQRLQMDSNYLIAGDFSNFDGSLKQEGLRYIGYLIDMWYFDDANSVRHNTWLELYSSRHVQLNHKYEFLQGLPSGHPLTSIVNSIYNLGAIRYVMMRLCSQMAIPLEPDVYRAIVYGDDNIISFNKEVFKNLDPDNIVALFSELGLRYGPASKDGNSLTISTPEEVSFLKRSFALQQDGLGCLAPLSLDSLLETINWTRRGALSRTIIIDKVDNFFCELSLHGVDVFNKYAPLLNKSAQNILHHVSSFSDFDRAFDQMLKTEARW